MNVEELKHAYKEGKISKEDFIKEMYAHHQYIWQISNLVNDSMIEKIEIGSDICLVTKEGMRFIIPKGDMRSPPLEMINFGEYEKKELEFMRKALSKRDTMLDIGSNIGWYSVNLSGNANKIIAFEPIKATFDVLQKNVFLNNIKNVECRNYGLSDKNEEIEFFFYPSVTVAASMKDLYADKDREKIRCSVKTLDSLNLKKVDFIKCDVEGAELFVMKGAIETLKKHTPILFLEMLRKWSAKFNYHPNDIIKLLSGLGYVCYALESPLRKINEVTDETLATNFVFIIPDKHHKRLFQ